MNDYRKDGEVSFSRNSSATYIIGGVVKSAAVNEPRFEGDGLLSEGASTNLAHNIDTWVESRCVTEKNTADTISPDGKNNALKISTNGDSDPFVIKTINIGSSLSGKTLTYSVWLWVPAGSSNEATLYLFQNTHGNSGNNISMPLSLTSTPTRYVFTREFFDEDVLPTCTARVDMIQLGTLGNSVFAWGAQIELGNSATSYIPTATSQVTRAKDEATIPATNIPDGDWTISLEAKTESSEDNNMLINCGDYSKGMFVNLKPNKDLLFRFGSSQLAVNNAFTLGASFKLVIRKDASKIYASLINKDNSANHLSDFEIGSDIYIGCGFSGNNVNGNIKNIQINDRKWTDQEVSDYVNS